MDLEEKERRKETAKQQEQENQEDELSAGECIKEDKKINCVFWLVKYSELATDYWVQQHDIRNDLN